MKIRLLFFVIQWELSVASYRFRVAGNRQRATRNRLLSEKKSDHIKHHYFSLWENVISESKEFHEYYISHFVNSLIFSKERIYPTSHFNKENNLPVYANFLLKY